MCIITRKDLDKLIASNDCGDIFILCIEETISWLINHRTLVDRLPPILF